MHGDLTGVSPAASTSRLKPSLSTSPRTSAANARWSSATLCVVELDAGGHAHADVVEVAPRSSSDAERVRPLVEGLETEVVEQRQQFGSSDRRFAAAVDAEPPLAGPARRCHDRRGRRQGVAAVERAQRCGGRPRGSPGRHGGAVRGGSVRTDALEQPSRPRPRRRSGSAPRGAGRPTTSTARRSRARAPRDRRRLVGPAAGR